MTAHTGTNVWATNLNGDNVDYSYTDLITPAIGLPSGLNATLRYWQYYDFNTPGSSEDDPFADIVMEAAQVALSTDNGATWKDLSTPSGTTTDGWEEVAVDIGKYAVNWSGFGSTTSCSPSRRRREWVGCSTISAS